MTPRFAMPVVSSTVSTIDSPSTRSYRSRMASLGYGLVGLDAVVVCESPRIAPVADAIRSSIAGILSVPEDLVSVKGKTTEGMGFEGRGEGISAWAVALLCGALPPEPRGGAGQ